MGHPRPLFLFIFVILKPYKTVNFSGIWIRIVRVEGKHADHLTILGNYCERTHAVWCLSSKNRLKCFVTAIKSYQHFNGLTFPFLAGTKLHVHGVNKKCGYAWFTPLPKFLTSESLCQESLFTINLCSTLFFRDRAALFAKKMSKIFYLAWHNWITKKAIMTQMPHTHPFPSLHRYQKCRFQFFEL